MKQIVYFNSKFRDNYYNTSSTDFLFFPSHPKKNLNKKKSMAPALAEKKLRTEQKDWRKRNFFPNFYK